ncbi:MAG TPA: polysaccharide deacetylase family protein [Armatimonadota bacterium]|nr:polysaccharide deacetylase family protein [Armatimonadota bacterium]
MKDEEKSVIMATPIPHQFEAIQSASFQKFYRGNPTRKEVAFTFDDGPHKGITEQLLAVLKQYNVKATFFVVGKKAEQSPELVKTEFADGHCIANHTYHHDRLVALSKTTLATEIDSCSDVINKITGKRPQFFRPPGGTMDVLVTNMAQELGYRTVLWSINSGDFERPGKRVIINRVMKCVSNGSIILFHDGVQQTIDALPEIITTLRGQGYEFVTIDDMVSEYPDGVRTAKK